VTDKKTEPADPPLTAAENASVAQLTETDLREIDDALLSNATTEWRKVAMIVGLTMSQLQERGQRVSGIPDVFYAQRVQRLVEVKRLEAAGNLAYMRFSEVRLPGDA